MKKINQITNKKELQEWITEKRKRLDRELILRFEEYHKKLNELEEQYSNKLFKLK